MRWTGDSRGFRAHLAPPSSVSMSVISRTMSAASRMRDTHILALSRRAIMLQPQLVHIYHIPIALAGKERNRLILGSLGRFGSTLHVAVTVRRDLNTCRLLVRFRGRLQLGCDLFDGRRDSHGWLISLFLASRCERLIGRKGLAQVSELT